jgi:diketogulonate reductase-like aldo/keto reductase
MPDLDTYAASNAHCPGILRECGASVRRKIVGYPSACSGYRSTLAFFSTEKKHSNAIIPIMKYETIHSLQIPKIGFGTWTIGGEGSADLAQDARSLAALRSALDLGYTHFDTAEYYAAGHSEELLGQAVRASGLTREALFITSKVSPEHLQYEAVLHSCENSLRRLGMDYLDLYLIHWPKVGMKLPETFRALNKLVVDGKVRHLGVSNFNLKLLKESLALSETPLLTNQVSYSLPDRTSVENGVLAYCQENNLLLTAYSPVKRRFIQGNKPLRALAKEKGVTPQQIALAWLVQQPRVITIPMSFNPQHQAENLAAAEIVLTESELEQLGR